MSDRGASDVIGFVLVFALVLSTVAVVYSVGLTGLQDVRDTERVNNAVRAFDVLADNVDDTAHGRVPSRATEIKLADATLSVGDPIVVNVTAERYRHPDENYTNEFTVDPIVYQSGDERVVYANGAVIRASDDGATMQSEPRLAVGPNLTTVQVIDSNSVTESRVSGTTTALVRADRVGAEVGYAGRDGPYNVTVRVTSPRVSAWRTYLERRPGMDCDPVNGQNVSCTLVGTDDLYVSVARLDVSIE